MLRGLVKRIPDWTILIVLFGLVITQTVLSLRYKSSTFDEATRFPAGYSYLLKGDYRLNPEHPPFIKLLVGVPLLLLDIRMPPEKTPWHPDTQFPYSHQFLYEYNDADTLLFLGRLSVLPLSLLLGTFVFLWAKELFGRSGSLFALFLYSFEPNILAHGGLVNTDLGITCFIFLTIYGFYQLLNKVSPLRLLLTGFAFGLALVTKFSSLWIIPILLLLGLSAVVSRPSIIVQSFRGHLVKISGRGRSLILVLVVLIAIGLIGYLTIWGSYRFRYEASAISKQSFHGFWDQSLPEQPLIKQVFLRARESRALPEAYLFGLSRVIKGTTRDAFLMGEVSKGWWYYFLVTFVVKTPLPLILLLALALSLLPKLWRENRVGALFLIVPVLIYFGIASASRLNIGHRHLLPIYPFLFVLAAAVIPWFQKQKVLIKGFLAVLPVWYMVASVSIFPHYLAYFNELVGGPENGYKYLVDSNLDWGQDLRGLKRYMDKHGIKRVWLSYFGTASPDYYGIAYNYLPSYIIFNPRRERVPTPFVAISATNLQGIYLPALRLDPDTFAAFRKKKPLAKVGYSIFIYHLNGARPKIR
ncbi:MAG: ArnT family glycosyltransferase [Candidatus Binatia bacterium]